MHEMKKFGILSVAKVQGLLMAIIGLVFGLIYGLIGIIIGIVTGDIGVTMLFIIFTIIMPIAYGTLGFLMGAFGTWAYNIIAAKIGGITIDLKKTK